MYYIADGNTIRLPEPMCLNRYTVRNTCTYIHIHMTSCNGASTSRCEREGRRKREEREEGREGGREREGRRGYTDLCWRTRP